jgi:hypothetical protein
MVSKIRPYSVIRAEAPLPPEFTQRHALYALYVLQDWECLPTNRPDPYAPGFFYNRIQATLNGLQNVSRTTVLRHLHTAACLVCDAPIDLTRSTLDHLMPLHDGGPQSPSNALMLCRHCNSSKGARDLLAWWLFKGYKVNDLPRNILCLYARIYWQHLSETRLAALAPAATHEFLVTRLTILPSEAHRIALIGSTYAGCAFARWLKEPPAHA